MVQIEDQLFQSILRDDSGIVEELLQNETEIDFNSRDVDGRTLLDLAAILGRCEILHLLLQKSDTITPDSSGYSPLHLSAVWGQLKCLKILVNEGNGDYTEVTRHNENVKQLALRYNHMDCVRFIECTEARVLLKNAISSARETLSNGEKIAGKWNKDDKNKVTSLCNEKAEWLERNPDAEPANTTSQREDFQERYEPHLAKLTVN